MSNSYSMWPVILIPYNPPPWLCMKQSNLLLSLLIPGPKGPAMDIDVYLQPLIDDLKILWGDGTETYDAFMKQNFQLHASLLWTINDFSAYGILSGWSTKELSVEKLEQLDKSIQMTLCKLERVFMPTFFDVMVHLAIHLANEAKLGGPVQFRWMYTLKVIRVRPHNLYDLPEQKDEMEPYQLIDLVERGETNQEVELENDNIRIEREDIDGVSVEGHSLNNEEEVDLVVVDEPDHENVDDFSDSATDEDTSEYDEVEDDDWF
ncbi:hypothetical protein MTR67_052316 [Solanum verrucosum]|uniref:DUF4218 domain-containing protein n=1 Tax=Solanum verrucosum TaxID=315347 RepID=A0AAF0V939_SOLVR|nr:hypothetical protein MTR67_052316 [Solanum verrucosum]